MDPEEFRKLLRVHDFLFEYSDDRTAYRRGSQQQQEIMRACTDEARRKDYAEARAFAFGQGKQPDWWAQ